MGFVVHTSAFTAHSSAIPGKLWFLGNFNSNIGHSYGTFKDSQVSATGLNVNRELQWNWFYG